MARTIYLEVASVVTVFIVAGRYLERRAKHRSGAAMRALLQLGAKDVSVVRDGAEVRIPVEQLSVGDVFVVRPGERIATDGEVIEGSSAVDTSMLTGESVPAEVSAGQSVVGASVNVGGRLTVRATRVGADTQLARMAALVTQAQAGKAPVQRLADRVSAVFVPVVIGLAALTWIGWYVSTGVADRGLHRRRRGAHHRLPVRPGSRDTDSTSGRYRARRPARDHHPRSRGARVHAARGHRRPRQDRHGDHRPDGGDRRR